MSNDPVTLEQTVLKLAAKRRKAGVRRVPLDEILQLSEVREYFPEDHKQGFIPDELCRCLKELSEDGVLSLHDINLRQGADGYWMIVLAFHPAISITALGALGQEELKGG